MIVLEKSFILIYGLTFVISMAKYPRYFNTPLKFIPILFLYTFLNEFLGGLVLNSRELSFFSSDLYNNNTWVIYNIYTIVFNLYFLYVYWNYLQNEGYKKFTIYAGCLFIVIAFINILLQDFSKESQVLTYCFGALNLIVCGILYFNNRRINSKAPFGTDDILSYLSLGLILFYIGYLPIKITRYFFIQNNISESIYVRPLHLALIVLMYLVFIIGFLKMRRMPPIKEKK
jgi:hypothetical protein